MRIEDAENGEEFWAALVKDGLGKAYQNVLIPMAGLPEDVAIDLAVRMKVSLLIQNTSYVFSTVKEGTMVQMGEIVERH